jgi:hypothetical protein
MSARVNQRAPLLLSHCGHTATSKEVIEAVVT